jgi:hypothetical protein
MGVSTHILVTVIREIRLRVFEKRVLRRIYEPKMDEKRRKLHNEELNDLYSSPSIIRVMKLRRIRWTVHVARMGERRGVYRVWWGNLRERDNLKDTSVDGR